MNYISQLNAYRIRRLQNPLSTNGIALYFVLLEYCNMIGWPKRFTVANSMLEALSGLSRNALHLTRNELTQKGYIEYKKGTGNQAGIYLIVCFDTQTDTQINTHADTQTDTHADTQTQHSLGTLNKLNQTKQKKESYDSKKEKSERNIIPPTVEMVERYCSERRNGISAQMFVDHYTTKGWLIGKNRMVDWQSAVRTWEQRKKEDQGSTTKVWEYLR